MDDKLQQMQRIHGSSVIDEVGSEELACFSYGETETRL